MKVRVWLFYDFDFADIIIKTKHIKVKMYTRTIIANIAIKLPLSTSKRK